MEITCSVLDKQYKFDNVKFSKGGDASSWRCYKNFKIMANMPRLTFAQFLDVFPCICIKPDFVADSSMFINPTMRGINTNISINGSIPPSDNAFVSKHSDVRWCLIIVTQERMETQEVGVPWKSTIYDKLPPDAHDDIYCL